MASCEGDDDVKSERLEELRLVRFLKFSSSQQSFRLSDRRATATIIEKKNQTISLLQQEIETLKAALDAQSKGKNDASLSS